MNRRSCFIRLLSFVIACSVLALAALLVVAQSNTRPLPPEEYLVEDGHQLERPLLNTLADATPNALWIPTTNVNAPPQARDSSAVWTGTEMIVWGGFEWWDPAPRNGGRYRPATDTWHTISTVNAPPIRAGHSAIWTGKEMIVWGGGQPGGRYNPTTDTWQSISAVNSPTFTGRIVWTGNEMLVWQGQGSGARYDPNLDIWHAIPTTGAPNSSTSFAIWMGSEMLVPGGRYNPATDTWRPAVLGDSSYCYFQVVAWTGEEVLTYGWNGDTYARSSGCRYLPESDTVLPLPPYENMLPYVAILNGVWTGSELIVVGRDTSGMTLGNGVYRFKPATNTWSTGPFMSCSDPAYSPALGTIVWTGSDVIVWGAGEHEYNSCPYVSGPSYGLRYKPLRRMVTFEADADTYIASTNEWDAFGSEPLLWAGIDPGGYGIEKILMHFPVSLPSQSIIENAQLFLYQYAYTNPPTNMNASLHRVTKPWTEYTPWHVFANSYVTTPTSTSLIGTSFGWYSFDATSIIDLWIKGVPNYGILLAGATGGARNEHVFFAREYSPPLLNVLYLDPLSEPIYAPDTVPPSAVIANDFPRLQSIIVPLPVQWMGSDRGRGIHNFDVQVRDQSTGDWNNWYSWAAGRTANFTGESGHTYCFRVRARDYAGNVGNWSIDNQCTTFYAHAVTGQIVDHHQTPVANATLQAYPAALTMTVNALNGQYALYFADDQSRQITVTQPMYAAPPVANIVLTTTDRYDFIMQPTNNVVLNSNFESSLASWTISGTVPVSMTDSSHSGSFAVTLNPEFTSTAGAASVEQALAVPVTDSPQVLSFMYSLTATSPLSNSQLEVTLATTGTMSTIWSTQAICAAWCHAWVDVSAWRGQAITLTVSLAQMSGETIQATLDEIVLGSWRTPIVEQVAPSRINAHVSTVITLTGQNFLAEPLSSNYITGPTVSLNMTPIEAYWINTSTLSATVPASMPFGLYTVWVSNPGGFSGALRDSLRVGHAVILPLIAKNN